MRSRWSHWAGGMVPKRGFGPERREGREEGERVKGETDERREVMRERAM